MGDKANQVGKTLYKNHQNTDLALKRYIQPYVRSERVLDTFDSTVPFIMTFKNTINENALSLDLIFRLPGPTTCCDQSLCSACESFDNSPTIITLSRPYIAGSIALYIRGALRNLGTDYEETSPSSGTVTLLHILTPATIVRVCYIYEH